MVRSDQQTVIASLTGNYRPEHMFTLKQSLAAYKHYQHLLAECDREMEKLIGQMPSHRDAPPPSPPPGRQTRRKKQFHFDMRSELVRLFGVDLTEVPGISALTAHVLLSEIGPDLSWFPSAAAFANWLALCPGNKKRGGKVLSSKTAPATTAPVMLYAWPHKLWLVAAPTWETTTVPCALAWEAHRLSPPRPTSWPVSSTTSSPPARSTMRPSSPKNRTYKRSARTNDSAGKPTTSASNSYLSLHKRFVHEERSPPRRTQSKDLWFGRLGFETNCGDAIRATR
ncbi:MAG TPA: transposase [Terracidiphilus sp.]